MSMIQRSSTLVGRRSRLIAGTARCRTVRSMTYSRQASVRTPRPTHSRRPARLGGSWSSIVEVIGPESYPAASGGGFTPSPVEGLQRGAFAFDGLPGGRLQRLVLVQLDALGANGPGAGHAAGNQV